MRSGSSLYALALALVGANVVDARTYTSKDGYATAVFVSASGVERIRTTAESHRRIAIISAENAYISTSLRVKAYRDTLARHGIAPREDYIAQASRDYSFKSGKWRAKELLGIDPRMLSQEAGHA